MPKITLFNAETVGVDMKTNPLFLGNKKLHAAVNLAFDEGVVKTRPGIRYGDVLATGCFQGVGEYRPARGISSRAFGESGCSLFVVVDGAIYRDACPTGFSPFTCTGQVFIYQAENYLIFQSPETNTFWWDGTTLTESPGMNEADWNDPDPQRTVIDPVTPVANIPACESTTGDEDLLLMFYVIDTDTQEALAGADVIVYRNERVHAQGVTGEDGRWSFRTKPRTYTYVIEKACFTSRSGTVVVTGNQEVVEALTNSCTGCEWDITSAFAASNGALTSVGTVTVENTGTIELEVLSITTSCNNVVVSPTLPLIVPVGESAVITVESLSCELLDTAVIVVTNCGSLTSAFETDTEGGGLGECSVYLSLCQSGDGEGNLTDLAYFTFVNDGPTDVTITNVVYADGLFELSPEIGVDGVIVPAGTDIAFTLTTIPSSDTRGTTFIVENNCGNIMGQFPIEGIWNSGD